MLTIGYVLMIRVIQHLWSSTPDATADATSYQRISVVVAARNESKNIHHCIQSILNGTYSIEHYEVIVVDDHSEDGTPEVIEKSFGEKVRLLRQQSGKSGKKAALSAGIAAATGDLISVTDADTKVPPQWLSFINSAFANQKIQMVTGPVMPRMEDNKIHRFQCLDFAATMGVTAAGLHTGLLALANGANMAFRKSFFHAAGGFESDRHVASGDDIFLMQKALTSDSERVLFLKSAEAVAVTAPEYNWKSLIRQRRRWAGKTRCYTNHNMTVVQAIVFCFTLTILVLALAGLIVDFRLLMLALAMAMIKLYTDYHYLSGMTQYFGYKKAMKNFVLSFLIYGAHILMSGWFALIPSPTLWKDRVIGK
jgi:poly-beta-1,6-N-acetyl-D-glucosamine synthase